MGTLPDFIIIGAQRSGTTSLFSYLTSHPSVIRPFPKKEIHYFDKYFKKGIWWYRSHFPSTFRVKMIQRVLKRRVITGEATPYYMFHPRSPERVRQAVPEVKLIALLRNPVDRALSHYYHEVSLGHEKRPFSEALRREKDLIDGEAKKIAADEGYFSSSHQRYSYFSRGIYIEQIEAWRAYFPKGQLFIMKSEDLFYEPRTALQRILKYLDLPPWQPKRYTRRNMLTYEKMDAGLRRELSECYEPYNRRLYDYAGMDFNW